MTLIAAFSYRGCWAVLGDALLTADGLAEHPFALPTTEDIHRVIRDQAHFKVTGLTQKVHLLNDNQIACCSGFYMDCKEVIDALRRESPTTEEELSNFTSNLPNKVREAVSFFVLTRSQGETGLFSHRCLWQQPPPFDHVVAAGSGKSALFETLRQMGQTHVVTGSPNPLEFIVSMALQAAGNAIAQELLSGSPVRDRWGGAFEIAGFVGGKARKIENVLFLYWLARRNQEKGEIRILQNPIIFKPGYFGNLMLLRFAFIEQAKEALRVSREGVYLIPEFIGHAPDNLESIKPPDFSYDFLASNVFLEDSGSITGAYCRLDYFGSGEKPVAISEVEPAQYDFIISQDYFMKLGKGGIQH